MTLVLKETQGLNKIYTTNKNRKVIQKKYNLCVVSISCLQTTIVSRDI